LKRYRGHSRRNSDLAFHPNSSSLAVATMEGAVELWPVDFDPEGSTLKAHLAFGVHSLALDADRRRVAGAGIFSSSIDELATHRKVAQIDLKGALHAVFSPNGEYLAAGFSPAEVRIWKDETGKLVHGFKLPAERVSALAFSGTGNLLAAGLQYTSEPDQSTGTRIILWDVASGEIRRRWGPDVTDPVFALALSADGKRLITGTSRLVFRSWNTETGQAGATLLDRSNTGDWGPLVALSPDGQLAALGHSNSNGSRDPSIELIEIPTVGRFHTLGRHARRVRLFKFNADGTRLASASEDDTVRVWDIATGQEVLSRPAPRNIVDLGFSRDGKTLIAVGIDGSTRIWQTGE